MAAVAVCAAAAGRDLRCRCIDNGLVALLLLLWVGLTVTSGWDGAAVRGHLAVGGLAFVVGLLSYLPGWVGGGDVKLAAAVFLWAGPEQGLRVLAIVALAGLVLGLLGEAARRLGRLRLPAFASRGLALISAEHGVPYGVALSLGGVAAALGV